MKKCDKCCEDGAIPKDCPLPIKVVCELEYKGEKHEIICGAMQVEKRIDCRLERLRNERKVAD